MMRTAAIIGVALVSLVTVGGQASGQGGSDPAVKAIADSYVKASLAGDAKAIAALYAEDATEMPPNQPSITGRAAIEQFYTKMMAGMKMTTFTITHLESRASADVAYDVGTLSADDDAAGSDGAGEGVGQVRRAAEADRRSVEGQSRDLQQRSAGCEIANQSD